MSSTHWALGYGHLIQGQLDEAAAKFRQGIGINLSIWFLHLDYAGTLALQGNLEEAKREIEEHLRLRPAFNTLKALKIGVPWIASNQKHWEMRDRTLNEGLRRIGFTKE